MQTPDLPRVPREGHDGPWAVGLDIPDPDGLVVGAADDAAAVELDAAHPARMAFERSHVTLSAQPALAQLVALLEYGLPREEAAVGGSPALDLVRALSGREAPAGEEGEAPPHPVGLYQGVPAATHLYYGEITIVT